MARFVHHDDQRLRQRRIGWDADRHRHINISITAVNDAPVNTVPGEQRQTLIRTSHYGLSISDVDAGRPQHDSYARMTNGTLTVTGGTATISGSGTATVTLTGPERDQLDARPERDLCADERLRRQRHADHDDQRQRQYRIGRNADRCRYRHDFGKQPIPFC